MATDAVLPANLYNNGASGVGATLTAVSLGVLTVDTKTVALNDIIIVKNEVTTANNGMYKCTTAGAIGVFYVLTRVTNMDQATEISQAYSFVTDGSANINTSWNVNAGTFTVGTTGITWNLFTAAPTFVAGNGLDLTGNTFSVNADNSTTAISSDNVIVKTGGITDTQLSTVASGATVGDATHIPIITFTNAGRVTSVTSAVITSGASETFAFFMGN